MRLVGTTDTNGDATVLAERSILGWLVAVGWIDGDLTDGVDAVLSVSRAPAPAADTTLLTLSNANADAFYYPRVVENDVSGVALATTTLMMIEGTLKLVIASGGSTHTGGCIVYYTDR
jgi:hypothetical protein